MKSKVKYIAGIDEAGRGPLAGPVAVGVASVPFDFDWNLIPGVGDSKKVSVLRRHAIFERARTLKKSGILDFSVCLVSARVIDRSGITNAVARGIERGMRRLNLDPRKVSVRLDGLLKAPPLYMMQKTIVKGDSKEKVIGLASIVAKVTRDRHMVRLAKRYSEYGLEVHKGYGTLLHRKAIHKHGLSLVHRKTFCGKFQRGKR
jgi:ribonuclease HII